MAEANIPNNMLYDDAVRFISERHHTTAENVMDCYAAKCGEDSLQHDTHVKLEDNEMRIIHDLINMYDK